jgi:MraZ protein
MRFSGIITAKLDAKGRVYFPSAFRRQLPAADSDLMIRRDVYQPCLVVYPRTVWESEVDRLGQRLNRWNPREAMLLRRFMAGADLLTLDDDGRFLLPKRRLEEVDIAREVAFVGVGDRVELWNVEAANALAKPDDELASLMETTLGAPGGEALL